MAEDSYDVEVEVTPSEKKDGSRMNFTRKVAKARLRGTGTLDEVATVIRFGRFGWQHSPKHP